METSIDLDMLATMSPEMIEKFSGAIARAYIADMRRMQAELDYLGERTNLLEMLLNEEESPDLHLHDPVYALVTEDLNGEVTQGVRKYRSIREFLMAQRDFMLGLEGIGSFVHIDPFEAKRRMDEANELAELRMYKANQDILDQVQREMRNSEEL